MDSEAIMEDRYYSFPAEQVPLHKQEYERLIGEVVVLRCTNESLQSKFAAAEEAIQELRLEREEILGKVAHLEVLYRNILQENGSLSDRALNLEISNKRQEEELLKRIDDECMKNDELEKEATNLKNLVAKLELALEEIEGRNVSLLKAFKILNPIKGSLAKIAEEIDVDQENGGDDTVGALESVANIEDDEVKPIWERLNIVSRLASEVETKVMHFKEVKEKEKRELQSSVVSLTEENRDITSLFRVALTEKEAIEKKLKEGNADQKKVALLQIAERGLRGVGFGFMIGSGGGEQQQQQETSFWSTTPAPNATVPQVALPAIVKSDDGDLEEEDDSLNLASTMEKIMKNLRAEILQLRRSMEEYRSDNERLLCLAEKQADEIAGKLHYIAELEERERVVTQHIEELAAEIKEAEAEAARWREACELEVEAGRGELAERDKMLSILKKELEKTKGALDISNGKLKLKEDLAEAAMGAQAAAERSLQLADTRAATLRERIEALTKQLEEAESRERNQRKMRHICWPLRFLSYDSSAKTNTAIKTRRLIPDMQALLQ